MRLEEASIRRALERLDPTAKRVIELRFGLGGGEPLALREVARQIGLSPEGVRKLERRALGRLAEERELQASPPDAASSQPNGVCTPFRAPYPTIVYPSWFTGEG